MIRNFLRNARLALFVLPHVCMTMTSATAQVTGPEDPFAQCEDKLETRVAVNPRLSTPFFQKREMHHPWWILRGDDGHLESTMGEVTPEDRKKWEWTSNCYSTHQGSHRMEMCEAELHGDELRLHIWGGLPAYFGELHVKIRGDQITCAVDANYPRPPPTRFRIIKKQFHAKKLRCKVGERYYAWLSIEFEEGLLEDDKNNNGEWRRNKIEGYIKPIIQKPAK